MRRIPLDNFLQTLGVAFILFLIALALIGISLLLTGKLKIKPGSCGRDPTKNRNNNCGSASHCVLCDRGEETKDEENEENLITPIEDELDEEIENENKEK
ncbi:hypothetical protein [Criblamydia sequanensis]|uniref:Conserved putative secreted protein n=1 Tax=Candidatus Criblamydia sequanensis CRIB-18 TaxID=1437425 RepID=A0A090CYQ3_9BACT|nr:hypothetical protein [Criblamydia sequanensis]CDR33676.1 Conserved putative secreted protein [Criblamydia sequanensis CRIB-18]